MVSIKLITAGVDLPLGLSIGLGLLLAVGLLGLYAWGIARLLMGNHTAVAILAIIFPFLWLAGFIVRPKPGSTRYNSLQPTEQAISDARYPMEAAAYHDTVAHIQTVGQRDEERSARRLPTWLILSTVVLAGVVGVLAAAFFGSEDEPTFGQGRSIDTQLSGTDPGTPAVVGEPLPPYSTGTEPVNDLAVGILAPAVTGEDFDGTTLVIEPGDGTPRAVLFLAHWCTHCQAEVPKIQQWLDAGGDSQGVELVSVSTLADVTKPNYPPWDWLERESWTPAVLDDSTDSEAYTSYGGGPLPYYVFVNSDGSVARRTSGELDIARLEQFLREISS